MDDYEAIRQLVARYNGAFDELDVEGWADCFTNDGVFVDDMSTAHECYITFVSDIGRHDKAVATGYYDDEFVVTADGPRFTFRRVYLDA